jgi:biopolymer transport protein ExbD
MIIPMIDIMFFLLVFFMLGTIYMVEQRNLPVRLPEARSSDVDAEKNFTVTINKDGKLYLENNEAQLGALVQQARLEMRMNPRLAIIIRADKDLGYGQVINVIDGFKSAGVARFGLAVENARSGGE